MYKRILANQLPPKTSAFVFGPRQTGKTTLIEALSVDKEINLLQARTFLKYNATPDLLFRELQATYKKGQRQLVWIDEVQKVPALLDVIHHTIEKLPGVNFILTGSSARKLRRGAANLLGGRAIDLKLHALSIEELGKDFDLDRALQFGSLPKVFSLLKTDRELAQDLLDSYVTTYLQDEVRNEALVRSLDAFQRFLEVASGQFSQQVNFSNIADDCLVATTTVQNYYSILEDTLVGTFLPAFADGPRKQFSQQPKFYFFDNGVTRALQGLTRSEVSNIERGNLFEQFVFNELRKLNDYYKKLFKFYLWRTHHGAEVDFLITRGRKILLAIECKSSPNPSKRDLSGLKAFRRSNPNVPGVVCAPVESNRQLDDGFEAVTINSLIDMVKKI